MKLIRTFVENKKSAVAMDADAVEKTVDAALDAEGTGTDSAEMTDRDIVESLAKTIPALQDVRSGETAKDGQVKTAPAPKPSSKRVWDLEADADTDVDTDPIEDDLEDITMDDADASPPPSDPDVTQALTEADAQGAFEVPNPLTPRKPRQAGRVKTRIMGFASTNPSGDDVFDRAQTQPIPRKTAQQDVPFPVGWLVVTQGPGRGTQFTLQQVVSTIGRGEDQTISLNFGDDTISRNKHAAIAYDDQLNTCFIGYGGKANLVRLNGRPVLATEQLNNGDMICIGQTDLRFVELCGPDFSWSAPSGKETHVG